MGAIDRLTHRRRAFQVIEPPQRSPARLDGCAPLPSLPRARRRCGLRRMARDFDRQVAEFQVRVAVLNGFTALGIPITEAVG
jgi:hypothetical protein